MIIVVDSNIYSSFIPQVQVKTGQVCDSGLATVDFIEENVNVGGHVGTDQIQEFQGSLKIE